MNKNLKSSLIGVCALAIAALATFAAVEILFPAIVPPELRGKWVVVEGEGLRGATLEFHRNGQLIMTAISPDRKENKISSTVQLDGNRFRITTPGGPMGAETTDNHEILELTDELFVTQDAKGEVLILERIPSKALAGNRGSGKWPRKNTPEK